MRPYVVGLTGGIGSGKSAAEQCFADLGIAVVDSDRIAHELTAPAGAAMAAIEARFGAAVLRPDGGLDRAAMRARAFSDPRLRAQLEAILHPMIQAESEARVMAATDSPYVVLMVPLLIETPHLRRRCDRVAVVDCSPEQQIQRVIARSGLSRNEVEAIMSAQVSRDERLAHADDVIDNSGAFDDLQRQIVHLDNIYRAAAAVR